MLARVTAQNRAEDKRLHAGKSLDADSVFGVVKSENGKGDENNDNKPEWRKVSTEYIAQLVTAVDNAVDSVHPRPF